ncbi:hypothetical protein [Marinagarivorans cellulosilyticus]|uniref:Uncharacterized protein n=1 Tax=Marinagarivorans cellulosilyticus TaxID=2721545 RepID=A0AAN1WHK4_9GAMM|nr:hypothetical protein [Marinagarivorans cellulosilyticus]BCD97721.1 hypothetical protein MARGE09_P1922 [Marinagarivorans cellulosilyticus]
MKKYNVHKIIRNAMAVTTLGFYALPSAQASECIYAPEVAGIIASSLRFPDATVNAKKSVAFKSDNFKNLYFIAAEVNSESFGSNIGVWTSNSLETGMIFSANTDAAITTVFPDGQKAGPKIKSSDHGYNDVVACFNKLFKLT